MELSSSHILQTTKFIESKLPRLIKQKKYYFSKRNTSLPYALEYDPKVKSTYILLEGKKAMLGEGRKKVVTKAIRYSRKRPKVVARAVQTLPMAQELKMTKLLQGKKGVFEVLGITKRRARGKTYHTIYSPVYKHGTFRALFKKGRHFSLYEKSKMAYHIMQGIESLHKRGIVHRDLGARNYLIKLPKGERGKRQAVACIADLGRAIHAKRLVKGDSVQGTPSYIAPEGLDLRKLKAKDYFATDIYAIGCVMYELFYEKTFPWHSKAFLRKKSGYKKYVRCLEEVTRRRRWELSKLGKRNCSQQFEFLVLRMLNADPKKRPKASYLRSQMGKLYKRAYTEGQTKI